jgi:hypothetical protein
VCRSVRRSSHAPLHCASFVFTRPPYVISA